MATISPSQLHVIVKNRDRILYDGTADAVTSINEKGTFDILPQHTNFISLIKDTVIVRKPDQTDQTFPLKNGVMKVYENTVQVYLGIVQTTPNQ